MIPPPVGMNVRIRRCPMTRLPTGTRRASNTVARSGLTGTLSGPAFRLRRPLASATSASGANSSARSRDNCTPSTSTPRLCGPSDSAALSAVAIGVALHVSRVSRGCPPASRNPTTIHASSGGGAKASDRTVNICNARACRASGLAPGSRSPNRSMARPIGTPFQWVTSTPKWNASPSSSGWSACRLLTR